MTILALDLGTKCGFAWQHSTGLMASGTWTLDAKKRKESHGMRFIRFREALDQLHKDWKLTLIYFEEVRRHMSCDAAHAYGGYLGQLLAWCAENNVEYLSVPVGEIKKAWTGKGNAKKEAMIEEARRRGYDPCDDNEADAIAILVLKTTEK